MSKEEKYKLALFLVIRNSKVMPDGDEMGMSLEEINKMSYLTMQKVLNNIDYEKVKEIYEEAEKE